MSIQLVYKNGYQLKGVAKDTVYDKDRNECMIISTGDGDISVILDDLKSIKALEENAHFDIVYFD